MDLRTGTELQTSAARHARALQMTVAACILALVVIAALSQTEIDRIVRWLGITSDVATSIFLAPIGGLLSLYVSWAAIWGVLGSGRWLSRVMLSFMIAHLTYILSIAVAEGLTAVRTGDPPSIDWRDGLALVAGFSYAFAGSLFVSMSLVWPLKLFRIRLLYFHESASYSHPRKKTAQTIPLLQRSNTTIASGRVSLLDMLGLITIFAVYLAAWKPIVEGWLPTHAMFGPAFAFILVLVVIASNGAVGLFAILLPLLTAMSDSWGKRTQIGLQGIHFAAAVAAALTGGFVSQDPETVGLVVIALVVFLAHQALLLLLMRKPSQRFRFRLVHVESI